MSESKANVIWITGLSGAGKSTLARQTVELLRADGKTVVMLDGDELREVFGAVAENYDNHGRKGRLTLAMQYSNLCRILVMQGLTVVIATISLFREVHTWNRANLPNYIEVYLKVPIEELRRRDLKKIYQRFDAGELTNVAGLDLPFDEPEAADLVIEFEPGQSVDNLSDELLNILKNRNHYDKNVYIRRFYRSIKDYSQHRPDYCPLVLKAILGLFNKPSNNIDFVDVGSGTGIWTRMVHDVGVKSVISVEPNDDMRVWDCR